MFCFTEEVHTERDHERLSMFEKMATENYLSRSKFLERQKLDTRVTQTAERYFKIKLMCFSKN